MPDDDTTTTTQPDSDGYGTGHHLVDPSPASPATDHDPTDPHSDAYGEALAALYDAADPVDDYATAEALARAAGEPIPTHPMLADVLGTVARMASTTAEAAQSIADHFATGEPIRMVSTGTAADAEAAYTGAELSVQRTRRSPAHQLDASASPDLRYAVVGIGRHDSVTPLNLADLREWLAACEAAGVPEAAIPTMGDPDQLGDAPAWLHALTVTG